MRSTPPRYRGRASRRTSRAVAALCVVGVLVSGGCSAAVWGSLQAGAASPSAEAERGRAAPATPDDGILDVVAWADGTPLEATTLSHDDAADLTLEPVTGDGHADLGGFQPTVVLADGELVVSRNPAPEDSGAVPEIGRWTGTYTPLTSSKGLVPDGAGRRLLGADTDGTTLVWTESAIIQGAYYAPWRLFAAPLAGGEARLLARSEQLWDGEAIPTSHRTVPRLSGGRVYLQAIVPAGDAGRVAALSASIETGELRVEATPAVHPLPFGSDVLVARTDGARSRSAVAPDSPETISSIDLLSADGTTRPVLRVTQDPEAPWVLETLGSTGDRLLIGSHREIVLVDLAASTSVRIPAEPNRPIGNLWACEDLVTWTTADPATPDTTTEAFLYVPSSGQLVRRVTPDLTLGALCGEGTVVWTDRLAGEREGLTATITRAP